MISLPDALEPSPVQADLAARFLTPAIPAIEALLLALRAETDAALATDAPRYGKPYPYGYCLEITLDVMTRLRLRMQQAPRSTGEEAVRAFLLGGGEGRQVWGILRERYFQNAMVLGDLYVDVANDSVDPSKPKVEILPLAASGLALVETVEDFVRIAEPYWNVRLYANTALPFLAPLFPFLAVNASGQVRLEARPNHMMRLLAGGGFVQSERWLAEGPEPSPEIVQAVREACPPDILALGPHASREASIAMCRALRAAGASDKAWLDQMCVILERIPVVSVQGANARL
ncbi:hypothetical protein [Caulobacter sp.]|uniref:hypothetical protein n=1 Tax=Caulobacter sp. TaxID=78 RepID=UPI001B16827F|nr:hypothetical protein [Caulobacter sp.]MBO9544901.1 hypothetical protein [Caulobacter sp.]